MTLDLLTGGEKRRHPRYDCHLGVIVRRAGKGASSPARTGNISASGVSLEMHREVAKPGDHLEGYCLIPGTGEVDFVGVVRWLRPSAGLYALGVEFRAPPAPQFYELLAREAFAHSRRRRPLLTPV